MRFFFGSPCLYNISFLVKDRQLRSGDLLAGGDICLGDPDLGNIILHLNLLYLHGVLHGKNDGFRSHIAICRLPLNKLVFPVGIEVLDQVRLLFRNPLVHNIPGIVKYLEVCSRDLTAAGDVGLGDFHFCGFIYECKVKGHCILVISFVFKCEFLLFITGRIAARGRDFLQIVFSVYGQVSREADLTLFIGRPHLDHIILFDQDFAGHRQDIFSRIKPKRGTFQCFFCFRIFLCQVQGYFLADILPLLVIDDDRCVLVAVGEVHITGFTVEDIAVCSLLFHDIISAKRKVSQFRNTGIICSDSSDQFILLKIVLRNAVCCFDVFSRIDFEGDGSQSP